MWFQYLFYLITTLYIYGGWWVSFSSVVNFVFGWDSIGFAKYFGLLVFYRLQVYMLGIPRLDRHFEQKEAYDRIELETWIDWSLCVKDRSFLDELLWICQRERIGRSWNSIAVSFIFWKQRSTDPCCRDRPILAMSKVTFLFYHKTHFGDWKT